jgi:thymidylate synthase
MHVEVSTPSQAVAHVAGLVLAAGTTTSPRGMETKEVNNFTLVIHEPWHVPFDVDGRNLRPFIGAVEALQLVGQTAMPEILIEGSRAFAKFAEEGVLEGAYGPRIYGSLGRLVQVLERDHDTRQAILTVYDSTRDLGSGSLDVPCTLSMQYFVRDGALCARTSMRSNDVWLGLPYDLVQFIALQAAVARALDLPLGWYSHSVGSMHLYAEHFTRAAELQPVTYLMRQPRSLWSGNTIGDISSLARRILMHDDLLDLPDRGATPFERWLHDSTWKYQ